jgi:hypothetical protein
MSVQQSPTSRRWWRRPRLTLKALLLVIALAGLYLAWVVDRARRVAVIDLGAPDNIAVGGDRHTPESIQKLIAGSSVTEVVIRAQTNVPYIQVLRVARAVEAAGVDKIRVTVLSNPASPALLQSRPAVAKGVSHD